MTNGAVLPACLLLLMFALLEAGSMRHETLTGNEAGHYEYGWRLLHFDTTRLSDSKMPFSMLNAFPAVVGAGLRPGGLRHRLETVEFGRYATVVGALLLGWLVFRWARTLYGPAAGLLALALFVLDPNILAHSALVTTDLYAAWMIALAVWAYWRFLNREGAGRWRPAALSAVTFALAQHAKFSAAYLAPIFILILVGHAAPEIWGLTRAGRWRALAGRFVAAGMYVALYVVVFIIIVNIGYWGDRSFRPLATYAFRSDAFRTVQAHLVWIPGLRMPLPWAYVEGLDWVLAVERVGRADVYLLGQLLPPGQRFPEYYAVTWLFKEPIATQLLLYLALGAYLARFRRFDFRRNEWFLACPVLFFAWYLTFVYKVEIGYRYALPVLPFLFVFTGSLLRDLPALRRSSKWLVGSLVLYLVVSVLSYYPHFIPYFNELVWDRKRAYQISIGSNLDWGQERGYLRKYLRRHPAAVTEPRDPQAGTIVVSGDFAAAGPRWLRENFRPVGHIAYAWLIYKITPEDVQRVTDPVPADSADKDR
jgi:4-amino-4-deoxy-L-arabinose transferase-like glycosyltransferase